jgi:non-specific serine/threonine protein kinase/serine/threonine-protein kinase
VAFLFKDQGRFAEAEALFREALERRRRVLGKDHPATLPSIYHMGGILEDQRKLAEAEAYYREALDKYRRVRGEEHPETLLVLTNLGRVLLAQEKSADAVELLANNESAARRAFTGGNALRLGRFIAVLGRRTQS